MGKLEEKVAIVTGAGQGIGRGIALAFAKEGAKVVVAECNPETAKSVVKEIETIGGNALAVVCDVGIEAQVTGMVVQAVEGFGPVDILVNNAQSWGPKAQREATPPLTPFEDFPEDWWDNTFQTGVKATFYCCKAVFPYMKDRGGKIINLGSAWGIEGHAMAVDYNANKEAIRALTRTAAREWGKYKINVNVICPAVVTPALTAFKENQPEKYEVFVESLPLRYYGDPEKDVGRTAVFLAGEDSGFITGQTLMVDGGRCMYP